MKKNLKTFILSLILIFTITIPVTVSAFAEDHPSRLVDQSDILTQDEKTELEGILNEISDRQKMDVVVVTTPTLEGKTIADYANDFFDYNGYGYGPKKDGILLLLSTSDRNWQISTSGYGITVFTNDGLSYLSEKFLPYLSDDEYLMAFETYARWCDDYITEASENRPYDTTNMPKEKPGMKWIFYSLLIGFTISFIIAMIKRSSMKSIVQQHSAQQYTRPGSFQITYKNDRFIRTYTTSRRIETKSDSGSSTNTGSSGNSHGGTGGRY